MISDFIIKRDASKFPICWMRIYKLVVPEVYCICLWFFWSLQESLHINPKNHLSFRFYYHSLHILCYIMIAFSLFWPMSAYRRLSFKTELAHTECRGQMGPILSLIFPVIAVISSIQQFWFQKRDLKWFLVPFCAAWHFLHTNSM